MADAFSVEVAQDLQHGEDNLGYDGLRDNAILVEEKSQIFVGAILHDDMANASALVNKETISFQDVLVVQTFRNEELLFEGMDQV